MPRSKYTLKKLIKEFELLIGCEIIEIFSQEKNSLNLIFFDGEDRYIIEYSADNKFGGIYIRNDFARAGKNTIDLLNELNGEVLQSVSLYNNDRIIKFQFINSSAYAVLFSGGKSNFLITNKSDIIINSLLNSIQLKHKSINELMDEHTPPVQNTENIKEFIRSYPFWLPEIYAIDFIQKHPYLLFKEKSNLILSLENYIKSLLNSNENYLYRKDNKLFISLIKLDDYIAIYHSEILSKIVQKYISYTQSELLFNMEYKALYKEIKKKKKSLKSKLDIYNNSNEPLERADKYRLYGDLLFSQTNPKDRIGKFISIKDWNNNNIDIKLDEKKNLIENGNKYYKKSKSALKEVEMRKKLLPLTQEQFEYYSILSNELIKCSNIKEIRNFKKQYPLKFNKKNKAGNINKNMDNEGKYKEFQLGHSYRLYVGKNAKNNDELTLKFAKPNDYWFHARGSSGSHCVLKGPGKDRPPKEIIKRASEIAAYYSKARNAKYTPVSYTQKKYVRKPKGANVGAVILSKETVIMVEPSGAENIL